MNIDNEITIGMAVWDKKEKTSIQRRADKRSIEQFAISIAQGSELEKYCIKNIVNDIKKYSKYDLVSHTVRASGELDESNGYRDGGDLLLVFDINGERKELIVDIKAVPPLSNDGRSTEFKSSFRVNCDSHNGMIKKGHIAIGVLSTKKDKERWNVVIPKDLQEISNRWKKGYGPIRESYEKDKSFYNMDEFYDTFENRNWIHVNDNEHQGNKEEDVNLIMEYMLL